MQPGPAIREARHRAGVTQAELARRTGTSQATISAYERGVKEPSVTTLGRLLAVTGSRLTVTAGAAPLLVPSAAQHARVARTLDEVLTLAAALPVRHAPQPGCPPLASLVR